MCAYKEHTFASILSAVCGCHHAKVLFVHPVVLLKHTGTWDPSPWLSSFRSRPVTVVTSHLKPLDYSVTENTFPV